MNISVSDELRARGRTEPWKRAYIGGTFDCLHRGHLALFAAARKIATEVVVSLNTDQFAYEYKRRVPVMPLADRAAVLQACRLVDDVVINEGGRDSKPAILRSGADCVVHGSDWIGDSLKLQMGLTDEWMAQRGIDLVILPYTDWISTTALLAAHRERMTA